MCCLPSIFIAEFLVSGPLVAAPWGRAAVILAAYVVTLAFSGRIVRFIVLPRAFATPAADPAGPRFSSSTVIGKCENLLTVTFVLAAQDTGLALIFAAKALVRAKDIEKNPGFYLGGMLVNLIWGLFVATVARWLIAGI